MQTFSMFLNEDAGDKFRAMSDDQFKDWKSKNPGAAAKADQIRKGKPAASSSPKGGEIVKYGTKTKDTESLKGAVTNAAKKLASDQAKKLASKAGGALVSKAKGEIAKRTSQVEKGKWAQGIKNAPKEIEAGDKNRFNNRQDEKQDKGEGGTDTAYAGGKYPKVQKPDPRMKGMEKLKKEKNKSVGDHLKDKWDDSIFRNKKKQADTISGAPGKLAAFIARNMRSTVSDGAGPSYGAQQSGLQQR